MANIISPAWNSVPYPITQEFGIQTGDTVEYPAEYTEPLGFPAGTHPGLDIGLPFGTNVYALNPGKVIMSGFSPHFRPKPVWIETTDNPDTRIDESGYTEIYGHLWTNKVNTGQIIKPHTFLGTSGEETVANPPNSLIPETGAHSGAHLHFELRSPEGKAVDPHKWLEQSGTDTSIDPTTPINSPDDGSVSVPSSLPDLLGILRNVSSRILIIAVGIILLAIGFFTVIRS
jgi:murein DD-endopeptidase MepM/ murein hydrolase activator NlpD